MQAFATARGDEPTEWAIALRDLCVVDIDDHAMARPLEGRFPALKRAPCEKTKRGFHYFFARSPLADELCFYDGCGAVNAHVDFKSVCATGTSGIIVVAPSSDKVWVRAPWDTPIEPIPEGLLRYVAKPGVAAAAPAADAPAVQLKLVFTAEAGQEELLVDAARLAGWGFFAAAISERWAGAGAADSLMVPQPADRATFAALLSVLETGDVPPLFAPTDARLLALDAVADMLGAPAGAVDARLRLPNTTRLAYRVDLHDLCPAWWRADAEEEARMASRTSSDASLVAVDKALAKKLKYAPLAKDARWLFADLAPSGPAAVARGQHLLPAAPAAAAEAALPRLVLKLLAAHEGSLIAAGGAVLGAVAVGIAEGTDVDLFLHTCTIEAADDIVAHASKLAAAAYVESRTSVAITFTPKVAASGPEGKPFQIVLCLHRDRGQVLESFDMAPCKVLARVGESGALVVEALPAWVESMRSRAFWLDPTTWSASTIVRAMKYYVKGFECAGVPGVRRAAFAPAKLTGWRSCE